MDIFHVSALSIVRRRPKTSVAVLAAVEVDAVPQVGLRRK